LSGAVSFVAVCRDAGGLRLPAAASGAEEQHAVPLAARW